jgi:hypothetical protein
MVLLAVATSAVKAIAVAMTNSVPGPPRLLSRNPAVTGAAGETALAKK